MRQRALALSRSEWEWVASYVLPMSVTLLAMALCLYGLESKSLWHDEFATLASAGWRGSWWDAIRNPLTMPTTPKPPLSFLVTHLFIELGDEVLLLRLPAVLFATLTVPLVFVLGRSLFDRETGLLGAFLLAIAPLHIRYAQEARMYTMFAFLSVLSLYFFWRAIRTRQRRWWIWFAVVALLALYTHLFAILTLVVLAMFGLSLLVQYRSQPRLPFQGRHFLLAMAVILLAYAPMMPFLMRGLASGEGLGGEVKPGWDLDALLSALRLFSGGSDAGLVVYTCMLAVGMAALALKERKVLTLTTMWIVLPVIIVLIMPFGHAVRIRYFLFALPVYLLLAAYGLRVGLRGLAACVDRRPRLARSRPARMTSAAKVLATVLLLGILAAIAVPSMSAYYSETKQSWREATQLVHSLAEAEDVIFVRHVYHQLGVIYYLGQWAGNAKRWTEANVQVFRHDLAAAFPPDAARGSWLIVPFKDTFLPGGDLEARIQPQYRLRPPIVLPPSRLPKEAWIISPTTFRALAVVEVVSSTPPSIQFWAEDDTLSRGKCTWLHWAVDHVREVYLEGEGVVGHDQRQVCPTITAEYELQVILQDGSASVETVKIEVSAP